MWIEQKYVTLLSSRLRNFKKIKQDLWNFSCPICGDSKKNLRAARGYIYNVKGKLRYHCHNCGITLTVQQLIKEIDSTLYLELRKEIYLENKPEVKEEIFEMKKPIFIKKTVLNSLQKIADLPDDHYVKQYVVNRQIPNKFLFKLYFAPKFKEFVNSVFPDKLGESAPEEPRLIIPIISSDDKTLVGFQGRSFDPKDTIRYMTIMLDETQPRIYGLDGLDVDKRVVVTEGPIDSMFIPNAIATAGGDIKRELQLTNIPKKNIVICYDAEGRNPYTVKKIASSIASGYNVVIFPESIEQHDINDMILAGYTSDQISKLIDENTYSGLQATLKLNMWKKI